jgi:hypothetical protein
VKCVEKKNDPLRCIVRTHQNGIKSILFQRVNNFKKYFQSKRNQIKDVLEQYKKNMERMENSCIGSVQYR